MCPDRITQSCSIRSPFGAMHLASGRRDVGVRKLFVRFAYTLLPIALFYHLAHNATHVFWEWSKLRRLI